MSSIRQSNYKGASEPDVVANEEEVRQVPVVGDRVFQGILPTPNPQPTTRTTSADAGHTFEPKIVLLLYALSYHQPLARV